MGCVYLDMTVPLTVPPLTVSQLTNAVKLSLESTFPLIYLQGEVGDCKRQSSGHLYFSLKDAHAQISAVMFKGQADRLKLMPKAGDQVVVRGEINVYAPKGHYQVIVRELSYLGLGELLQKLELLKVKLLQLGWFKKERKKPLPRFPKRIGVVTSPTGAVIQDILHVLTRRFSNFHLLLYPVKVQGEGAAQEIAQAIEQCNRYALADVLIVGRGGGSFEDLQPFNEEITASAIYHSRIPIISAVGHETDHCIADYVADLRAATPSAAAELVIAEKSQQLEYLQAIRTRMQQIVGALIRQHRCRLQGVLQHPFIAHPYAFIEWRMQKLDEYRIDLEQTIRQFFLLKRERVAGRSQQALALRPSNQIARLREQFALCARSLLAAVTRKMAQKRQSIADRSTQLDRLWQTGQTLRRQRCRLEPLHHTLRQAMNDRLTDYRRQITHANTLLEAFNPRRVLEKGYSLLLTEENHEVIKSVHLLKRGQRVKVKLADGEALVRIEQLDVD